MRHSLDLYILGNRRYIHRTVLLSSIPTEQDIDSLAYPYHWQYITHIDVTSISKTLVTWFVVIKTMDSLQKGYKVGTPPYRRRPADPLVSPSVRGDWTMCSVGNKYVVNGDLSPLRMIPYNVGKEKALLEMGSMKVHVFETSKYMPVYDERLHSVDGPANNYMQAAICGAYRHWKEYCKVGKNICYISTSNGHIVRLAAFGDIRDAVRASVVAPVRDIWYSHSVYDRDRDFRIDYYGACTDNAPHCEDVFDVAMMRRYYGDI